MNEYNHNYENREEEGRTQAPGFEPTQNTQPYSSAQPQTEQPARTEQPQYTQQSWSNGGYSFGPYTYGGNSTQPGANPYGQNYNPYSSAAAETAKKKKKVGKGISGGLVAILLCVCLLAGAVAGAGGALLVTSLSGNTPAEEAPVLSGQDKVPAISDPAAGDKDSTATIYHGGETKVVVEQAGVGSAEGSNMSMAAVVAAVKDSVVEITTETVVMGSRFSQYVASGAGSGVVIAKEGYIITNHHVIADANNITVRTTDGKEYKASLVGSDVSSDVAVIKIEPEAELTVAVLGDSSKLMVGETALAIGNPLGSLGGTVTSGIISALDRELEIDGESMRLLQTNAAVNPGNSGGGLFNMAGQLIGIVNAKSSGEDVEGLGFAIPVNTAEEIATQLMEYGYVRGRVDIGLSMIDITSIFDLMAYNLSSPGVYVLESPYNDQIRSGDRIQTVNGVAVSTSAEVKAAYRDCAVGDVITVSIVRGRQVLEVQITLREYVPNSTGVEFGN